MKNEKGVTLIELLGVLVILSVILILAGSILTSSMKTSNRATTDQRLQQEANYITEAIRNQYLEEATGKLTLVIGDHQLEMNEKVISEGYIYCFDLQEPCEKEEKTIDRSKTNQSFYLKLRSKDGQRTHEIKTEYSKLK